MSAPTDIVDGVNVQIGTKKQKKELVTISAPQIVTLPIKIRGIAPYVQHKFSAKAKAQIKATQEAGSQARSKKVREPMARRGLDGDGRQGGTRCGKAWRGEARLGTAGADWSGAAGRGLAGTGTAGMAWQGRAGVGIAGGDWMGRRGKDRRGLDWMGRQGAEWLGAAGGGGDGRQGAAGGGLAGPGVAGTGWAGKTGLGVAWLGGEQGRQARRQAGRGRDRQDQERQARQK